MIVVIATYKQIFKVVIWFEYSWSIVNGDSFE
jgi:hypothetical protein